MRGKLRFSRTAETLTRITPADAGKTSGIGILGLFIEDHPRGCGENGFAMRVVRD